MELVGRLDSPYHEPSLVRTIGDLPALNLSKNLLAQRIYSAPVH